MKQKILSLGVLLMFLASVLVTNGFVGLAVAQSSTDEVLSQPVQEAVGAAGGVAVPDSVIKYGADATPSWIITVDSTESLKSWAKASENREIKSWVENDTALVVAPTSAVIGDGLVKDSGLYTLAYVEHIGFNYEISLISPVGKLASNSGIPSYYSYVSDSEWGVGQATEANDTTLQQARKNISAESVSVDGSGVTVGIIDTGLNYEKSLYGDRIKAGKNFLTNETINKSAGNYSAIEDGNGHGSWVASAIASNGSEKYHGVAPNASLVIAKALSDDGSASTTQIARAVEWTCARSDIVSMSLGSPFYSEALANEVKECVNNGTVVVVAVGNSGYNPATMFISSPADTNAKIVSVAASTNNNSSNARIAYFSGVGPDRGLDSYGVTQGERPTVAAPGMKLTTQVATTSGTVVTTELSGTSMATPLVSGSIALLLDDEPSLSPSEVYSRIENTSSRMPHAGKYETHYGMVNASAMIQNTTRNKTQAEVRTNKAIARDKFYDAYSGNKIFRILVNIESLANPANW